MKRIITAGTRGSILALKQTEIVVNKIKEKYPEYEIAVKIIKTSGDTRLDIGSGEGILKAMFVKEIEEELLAGTIDFAVHSMKDMPENLPENLIIAAVPDRDDPRDVFISASGKGLSEMAAGSIIGTSSSRRKKEALQINGGVSVKEIRGNIHTRLKKLENGEYDALILAAAGMKRAGIAERITEYFRTDEFTPAPCQGAIAVEIREGDTFIREIMNGINNEKAWIEASAERNFSGKFGGGCKNPVGAFAEITGGAITICGAYYGGEKPYKASVYGRKEEYMELSVELFDKIKKAVII